MLLPFTWDSVGDRAFESGGGEVEGELEGSGDGDGERENGSGGRGRRIRLGDRTRYGRALGLELSVLDMVDELREDVAGRGSGEGFGYTIFGVRRTRKSTYQQLLFLTRGGWCGSGQCEIQGDELKRTNRSVAAIGS